MNNEESINHRPTWVYECLTRAREWKEAIGRFVAEKFINYAYVVLLGSGTTLEAVLDAILDRQVVADPPESLDLVLVTTNLRVVEKSREAVLQNVALLSSTQVIITGGALCKPLHSLTGPFAVESILSPKLIPDVVFFGAAGLSFKNGFTATYQFAEELGVQEALASRPTNHRVLVCDHTKFQHPSAWKAEMSLESMMRNTNQFTIVITMSEEEKEAVLVRQEIDAFKRLVRAAREESWFKNKDLALRVIDQRGNELRNWSVFSSDKETFRERPASGLPRPVINPKSHKPCEPKIL